MNISQNQNDLNKNPFILKVIGMGKSYFVKTPWWLKKIYSSFAWEILTKEKVLYLTFDDGPSPKVTDFVLDELRRFNAKACFFCIGKNVVEHPEIYKRVVGEGHQVGNHTFEHLNGWQTKTEVYLKSVSDAAKLIDSALFRPPYGRIKSFQAKHIGKALHTDDPKIIMWTVLSGDFDDQLSKDECLHNVILNSKEGSIIVFHDSEKSFSKLEYVLPLVLKHFSKEGYRFESLTVKSLEKQEEKTTI